MSHVSDAAYPHWNESHVCRFRSYVEITITVYTSPHSNNILQHTTLLHYYSVLQRVAVYCSSVIITLLHTMLYHVDEESLIVVGNSREYTHTHTHIHAYTHTQTSTRTRTHTHTHTHIHTHTLSLQLAYDMPHLYVSWLDHLCGMTHSYVWHDSFICVTWLIHMCDMTHSYVWHDSFICVAW